MNLFKKTALYGSMSLKNLIHITTIGTVWFPAGRGERVRGGGVGEGYLRGEVDLQPRLPAPRRGHHYLPAGQQLAVQHVGQASTVNKYYFFLRNLR